MTDLRKLGVIKKLSDRIAAPTVRREDARRAASDAQYKATKDARAAKNWRAPSYKNYNWGKGVGM